MSRTYRRKGYEDTLGNSYDRKGRKTASVYTIFDGYGVLCPSRWGGYAYRWIRVYREPTKTELYKRVKWYHGESRHANERSPSRDYRKARMVENRNINKRELINWTKHPDDYEPLWEANPRSHWWDWD